MEASALKAPPALLERIVLFLIPPAAREAVVHARVEAQMLG